MLHILPSQLPQYIMSEACTDGTAGSSPAAASMDGTKSSEQAEVTTVSLSSAGTSPAATGSQFDFSVPSPGPPSLVMGSSVQTSPEPFRGRDLEAFPPPLELPEGLVSRKTSSNSLIQSSVISSGSTSQDAQRAPTIMRRLSNRMSSARSAIAGSMGSALSNTGRRQSSAHTMSRDGSVGPSVIRNRLRSSSNSSALAPAENAMYSDSEDEIFNDTDISGWSLAGTAAGGPGSESTSMPELSPLQTNMSPSGTSSPTAVSAGPILPPSLVGGTLMSKLSKKKKLKKIFLVLDPDSAKICWTENGKIPKSVYLDDIKEIRTGGDLSQYRRDYNAPEHYETQGCLLIVDGREKKGHRMLHLMADSEERMKEWITAIDTICRHREEFTASLMAFDDKAVRTFWQSEMARRAKPDQRIDHSGLDHLCRRLHIHVPAATLLERFKEAAASNHGSKNEGYLDSSGFMTFMQLMKTRKDIQPIYQQYASDVELGLTQEDFFHFLRECQGEVFEDNSLHWQSVFANLLRKSKANAMDQQIEEPLRLTEAAFASYFTSESNLVLPREPRNISLDRPMNEYFISSSHNTYLLGRQVKGTSSVEGYIQALTRGCRCVEVDVWNGQNSEPIVVHGRTMSTAISFREVISTINKYAFKQSPFPLFISLEVRCSWDTQENMVKIMDDIFGQQMMRAPLDPKADKLPSPSELKNKILIKVKKGYVEDTRSSSDILGRRRGSSLTSPLQRPTSFDNTSLPGSPLLSPLGNASRKLTSTRINTINEEQVHEPTSNSPSDDDCESEKDSAKKGNTNSINPVLGALGIYSAGITFNGFDSPDAKTHNHIFSFKEKTFAKNSTPGEKKRAMVIHNMRHMIRVYPDPWRFSSSNFSPVIYWKRGVQMVAMNWQTFDLGMQINQAMFDSGADKCGYVLKPRALREIYKVDNGTELVNKRERTNVRVSIDVISAQQLMRPDNLGEKRSLDPYVEVELILADDKEHKGNSAGSNSGQKTGAIHRLNTKIVKGNGFNPEFGQTLTFPDVQTKYPELVFVRWIVRLADKEVSSRSPILATFTAKLSSLKQGYRTLPLLDHKGDRYLFSKLFCRIKVDMTSIYVPAPLPAEESRNNNRLNFRGPSFLSRSSSTTKSSIDAGQTI
ncbi:Phospholipase C [Coniochaeta pulveracea]|uniref:Phosphoinositide phospholipase C n=1 Tax=Coniochaeta pulveracea TaxID=177199 RepID=A0A420YAP1_9PEZI|nr:Phospholipase C [Coniochaeta pulveracea]